MMLSRFAPLAETDAQARKRNGEEAGYIQSGQLQLYLAEKKFDLQQGDSFRLSAEGSHQIRNPSSSQEAVVMWVITPPNY